METPAELYEKAKSFSQRDPTDYQLVKTQATAKAAGMGLLAGGIIGYYKGWNVYAACLIGAVVFGGITNIFIKNPYAGEDVDE